MMHCAGTADVRVAEKFAREQVFPAAVRGEGHYIAGSALVINGLVIDGIWARMPPA